MSSLSEISATTLIQRNEGKFLASALGEEIVMMNTDNGDYIGVNSVGSDVWNLLAEPLTVETLTRKVFELYDVEEAIGTEEISNFLQQMLQQEMLIIIPK